MITSKPELADAPGNVLLCAGRPGLPRDSVVNVSQLMTLDRGFSLRMTPSMKAFARFLSCRSNPHDSARPVERALAYRFPPTSLIK